MTFGDVTDEARKEFGLAADIKGVLVTEVDSNSAAAEKGIQAGNVIAEIAQEAVNSPAEIEEKLAALKKDGRKKALLLVSGKDGQLSFVVLTVD